MRSSCYSSTHHLHFCLTNTLIPASGVLYCSWLKRPLSACLLCAETLILQEKTNSVGLKSSFLQEGWNCICTFYTHQKLESIAAAQILSDREKNLLLLLVSFKTMWLFIKGLLRKFTETRRLGKFEEIRAVHCSTLNSYSITNEGAQWFNFLMFLSQNSHFIASTTYVSLRIAE